MFNWAGKVSNRGLNGPRRAIVGFIEAKDCNEGSLKVPMKVSLDEGCKQGSIEGRI